MSSFEAIDKFNAELPTQVKGQHLWVSVAMYRTQPGQDKLILDKENLLTIEGPGCYWCGETWRPGLEKSECKGCFGD